METKNIIETSKNFVRCLLSELNSVNPSEVFIISITGDETGAKSVSVALYSDVKVGKLVRTCFPEMYGNADRVLACANSGGNKCNGVIITLSRGGTAQLKWDGRRHVLNILNLSV